MDIHVLVGLYKPSWSTFFLYREADIRKTVKYKRIYTFLKENEI